MTDLVTPAHIEEAVAGLDLKPKADYLANDSELMPANFGALQNAGTRAQEFADNTRRADQGFTDRGMAVLRNMPTVQLGINGYNWVTESWKDDPNFDFKSEFDSVVKNRQLSPDYWHWLSGAKSKSQFYSLLSRAQDVQKYQQVLGESGAGWHVANFIAGIADPASFVLGAGMFSLGGKVASGVSTSLMAQRAVNAGFGAAAGVGVEGLRQVAGFPTHWHDYAEAAAAGFLLGGAFGPLARNPATADEAAAMVKIAKQLKDELDGKKPPTIDPPAVQGEAARDLQTKSDHANAVTEARNRFLNERLGKLSTEDRATYDRLTAELDVAMQSGIDTAPLKAKLDELLHKPTPAEQAAGAVAEQPNPAQQAVDAVMAGDVETALAKAQEALQPEPTRPPRSPEPTPPQAPVEAHIEFQKMKPEDPVPPALDAALKDIAPPAPPKDPAAPGPLPTPDQFKNNPNHMGDWLGADGSTYRIMANPKTGMYSVTKVGQGVVARELTDLKAATAVIPQGIERARLADIPSSVKPIPLIRGKYSIKATIDEIDGELDYKILDSSGKDVGSVKLMTKPNGLEVEYMSLIPDAQGKGLMQKAYSAIEKELGIEMRPSGELRPDGYAFWQRRNPELVKWHQQVEGHGDRASWSYYSPKRIFTDLHTLQQNIDELKAVIAKEPDQFVRQGLQKEIGKLEARQKVFQQAWDKIPADNQTIPYLKTIFKLGDPTELPPGSMSTHARRVVQDVLDRILPKGTKVEIRDGLPGDVMQEGLYDPLKRLVTVIMKGNKDPLNTAYHEGLHALRMAGAFTNAEWTKLKAYAMKIGADAKYNISARYEPYYKQFNPSKADLDELISEEWIAHMTADYLRGARFGGIADRMLSKMVDVFRKVRDALGIKGFRTINDIFDDIGSGVIADRTYRAFPDSPSTPRAQLGPQNEFSQLQDPAWRTLEDGKTPYSAEVRIFGVRIPRFDFEAVTGRSRNPVARLISGHFFNNAVGMADHSLTPVAAEMRKHQGIEKYMSEFAVTYKPAWKEWAEANGVGVTEGLTRQAEFREQIGMYIAEREGPTAQYHPAVQRVGEKVKILFNEQLKDMQNPGRHTGEVFNPVAGTETITDNLNYLWRQFDSAKVQNKINLHREGVEQMVAGAIAAAQPWIPAQYLQTLAKGYIRTVYNTALGLSDVDWAAAVNSKDFGRLQSVLQQHTQLSPQEIADVMARWRTRPVESGMTNTKHRLFLKEDHVARDLPTYDLDGNVTGRADLAFKDLLNNDVESLFKRYTDRVQGRVALAKIQVKHPETGEMLVNGITSDEDFAKLMRIMEEYGTEYLKNRLPNSEHIKVIAKDKEYLQFIYDRIKGIPDPRQTTEYAGWLRRLRAYHTTRLLGQVGVAQLGEFGVPLGTLGVKATIFSKVPAMRRMIDQMGDSRLREKIFDEIEREGIGSERLHGMSWTHLSDIGEMPFEVRPEATWKRHLDNALELGQKATFEMSGMAWVQQQEQRKVAVSILSWFSDAFMKQQRTGQWAGNVERRLAQLGLSPKVAEAIGQQMEAHASWKQVGPSRRLSSLNMDQWTDLQARTALSETLYRYTNKLIQKQDIGSAAFWMTEPNARAIFQFRSFVFQAWANQFQYNLHMGDFNAFAAMTYSIAWNAMVRAAQVYTIAATRSDSDKYKEKYLSPFELGKAGFERSGWSSILPMVMDTGLALGGQQGMFNARTSGQSQAIFGSPSFGVIDAAQKGLGGVVDSAFRGREASQAELRAFASLFPLMNQLQFSALISTLISDRPLQAPKAQPLF